MEHDAKRRKIDTSIRAKREGFLSSLSRRVSPPDKAPARALTSFTSPFRLSHVRDLPAEDNIDTVRLDDILGDPLIKEAWIFNFCFDVDWTMQHFDPDVRQLVKVKIIHGSWRREDSNKIAIDEACARWPNVDSIQAYLPDPFGTHHSKMFILFKHDDTAQVVIHTANMLSKDWTNLTQALWMSPVLHMQSRSNRTEETDGCDPGIKFKSDMLRYLKAYGNKLKALTQQIQDYDFRSVKALLVASVPSEFCLSAPDNSVWGHESLRRAIESVPIDEADQDPHFVFQVSSIASLPNGWIDKTLYRATGSTFSTTSIIFPTAEDVAQSLDGYAAGGSIHTKAQTTIHLKQISALRPHLCRWAGGNSAYRAGRHLAAPHIKTYVRFRSKPTSLSLPGIDWALLTSANLSTQAWGSAGKSSKRPKGGDETTVKIQSYEIGVLVHPALFAETNQDVPDKDSSTKMVPVFKDNDLREDTQDGESIAVLRMPYDLPLTPYEPSELPWSPQSSYDIADSHGRMWPPDETWLE